MINSNNLSKNSLINKLVYSFVIISLIGFLDAVWLTVKYYIGSIDCSVIAGCQDVLNSSYSAVFNIPVAILGAIFYLFILTSALAYIDSKYKYSLKILSIIPTLGFLFSLWLVYLQFFVINAICIYCMLSATTSTLLFILSLVLIKKKTYITI